MAMGDPHWEKVVLACPFDSDGFVDKSISKKTLTVSGNAVISTAQSKFGGASAYFDGSGDYLGCVGEPFGQADFAVEGWIYVTNPSLAFIVFDSRNADNTTNGFVFYVRSTAKLTFGTGAAFVATEGATTVTANAWHHVALARDSGVVRGFLNGVQQFAVENNADFSVSGWKIGHQWNGAGGFSAGYLDDLRITKGIARHTANFTPPAAANPLYYAKMQGTIQDAAGNFLSRIVRLHRRSNGALVDEKLSDPVTGAFALNIPTSDKHYAAFFDSDAWITYLPFNGDNNSTLFSEWGGKMVTRGGDVKISTAQSKFGGASAYFDGAGDYLALGDTATFKSMHSGADMTLEFWVYLGGAGTPRFIIDTGGAATATVGFWVGVTAGNALDVAIARGTPGTYAARVTTANNAMPAGAWKHVAVVVAGGTLFVFIDGVLVGSVSILAPSSANQANALNIGRYVTGNSDFLAGYIDDLRISMGAARYTANFTPPAAPHAETMSMKNALIYDHLTPA